MMNPSEYPNILNNFLGEIDDFQEEVLALSQNQEFMEYLAQCRQRGKTQGTISLAEIRQRLEIS